MERKRGTQSSDKPSGRNLRSVERSGRQRTKQLKTSGQQSRSSSPSHLVRPQQSESHSGSRDGDGARSKRPHGSCSGAEEEVDKPKSKTAKCAHQSKQPLPYLSDSESSEDDGTKPGTSKVIQKRIKPSKSIAEAGKIAKRNAIVMNDSDGEGGLEEADENAQGASEANDDGDGVYETLSPAGKKRVEILLKQTDIVNVAFDYEQRIDEIDSIVNYMVDFDKELKKKDGEEQQLIMKKMATSLARGFRKKKATRDYESVDEKEEDKLVADMMTEMEKNEKEDFVVVESVFDDTAEQNASADPCRSQEQRESVKNRQRYLFESRYNRMAEEVGGRIRRINNELPLRKFKESLAKSTVFQSLKRMNYWIMFAAATPEMELNEFNGQRIHAFADFLFTRTSKAGTIDRLGKPLSTGTITGILHSTLIALRLLGYIPISTSYEALIKPEEAKVMSRFLMRVKGQRRGALKYVICPPEVSHFAKNYPTTTNRDFQDVVYVLLKSVTGLRKSSMLLCGSAQARLSYPGIKLKDIRFFLENIESDRCVLSMTVTIWYEKNVRECGSEDYDGRHIKLRGRDDSDCPVKFVFLQCLYLNAFVDNCKTMMENGQFTVKEVAKETTLFRQTDSHGQYTTRPLFFDEQIMERFAVFLGLPTYCVSGHGLRHGHASHVVDKIIKAKKGVEAPAIQGTMKAMGTWSGRGYYRYIKSVIEGRVSLTETCLGDNEDTVMFDPLLDRHSLFGLAPDEYLTSESAIVRAAVSRCKALEEERQKLEKHKTKYMNFCEKFHIPIASRGGSVKQLDGAIKSLTDEDKKQYFILQVEYHNSASAYHKKSTIIRENFASYGNQVQLEENRLVNKLKHRRDFETSPECIDFENVCESVEKYRKTVAKYFYGPFSTLEEINAETTVDCWVVDCTSTFADINDFLHHADFFHKVVPYTTLQTGCTTKHAAMMLRHSKIDEAEPSQEIIKFKCKSKRHTRRYGGSHLSWSALASHFRLHWVQYKCDACGTTFTAAEYDKRHYRTHKCTSAAPQFIPITSKVVTMRDYILSCSKCKELRVGLKRSICLARSKAVADMLKDIPAFTNAAQSSLQEKYKEAASQLSQGGTAAHRLCSEFGLEHTTEETALDCLWKRCPCVAEEIQTHKQTTWIS